VSGSGVVFLMYHELESPGRPPSQTDPGYLRYIVRASDFRSQMHLLHRQGWRGVSVGSAVADFAGKTVAVTFDDGCESDLLFAAPALKEAGFGATFYITTDYMGKPGHLNQNQLCDLSRLGFEIGCHSKSHAYLTDLNDHDLQREIAEPKTQLEQILGRAVEHLSCPGGRHDQRVSNAAREAGYQTLTTSRIQKNFRNSDRFALGRVSVMRPTSLEQFEQVSTGRRLWPMRLQTQLRSAGQKLLGNSAYDRMRAALLRDRGSS